MSQFSIHKRNRIGSLLVDLQFGFMLVLPTLAAPTVLKESIPISAILLGISSTVLFVWTLLHNRLDNFNIRPIPKSWGSLITTDPYRLIRHPMCTSVLLGAAALASMSDTFLGWIAWATLAGDLL